MGRTRAAPDAARRGHGSRDDGRSPGLEPAINPCGSHRIMGRDQPPREWFFATGLPQRPTNYGGSPGNHRAGACLRCRNGVIEGGDRSSGRSRRWSNRFDRRIARLPPTGEGDRPSARQTRPARARSWRSARGAEQVGHAFGNSGLCRLREQVLREMVPGPVAYNRARYSDGSGDERHLPGWNRRCSHRHTRPEPLRPKNASTTSLQTQWRRDANRWPQQFDPCITERVTTFLLPPEPNPNKPSWQKATDCVGCRHRHKDSKGDPSPCRKASKPS